MTKYDCSLCGASHDSVDDDASVITDSVNGILKAYNELKGKVYYPGAEPVFTVELFINSGTVKFQFAPDGRYYRA